MGRRCADKIRRDWNYDAVFRNVLTTLETETIEGLLTTH